ncbi:hypothetical protein [Vibrio europaeus]|nr:hypothetical protein [Vibrio europaeus]MDC5813222.1 hypothetical protein [Vibrio europaeus]
MRNRHMEDQNTEIDATLDQAERAAKTGKALTSVRLLIVALREVLKLVRQRDEHSH